MAETSVDVIKRYLEDAIAAEKSFETQLEGFSKEGDNVAAQTAFSTHAQETRVQYQKLTARLEALGGSPSGAKSFLAHVFGLAPKTAQIGHEKEERTTQNLMMAFAVENSELAMYEALATVAEAAGDGITALLAREIQAEEKATAEKVWKLLPSAASEAFERVTVARMILRLVLRRRLSSLLIDRLRCNGSSKRESHCYFKVSGF